MKTVGVFAEDSLEAAHLIVLWDCQPGVSRFAQFLVVMCVLQYSEGQGQSAGNLSGQIYRWEVVITGDVFGNRRQVVKLSGEAAGK